MTTKNFSGKKFLCHHKLFSIPFSLSRVAFSNQQSYIAAISARFVQLQHGEIDKRVRKQQTFTKVCKEVKNPIKPN